MKSYSSKANCQIFIVFFIVFFLIAIFNIPDVYFDKNLDQNKARIPLWGYICELIIFCAILSMICMGLTIAAIENLIKSYKKPVDEQPKKVEIKE